MGWNEFWSGHSGRRLTKYMTNAWSDTKSGWVKRPAFEIQTSVAVWYRWIIKDLGPSCIFSHSESVILHSAAKYKERSKACIEGKCGIIFAFEYMFWISSKTVGICITLKSGSIRCWYTLNNVTLICSDGGWSTLWSKAAAWWLKRIVSAVEKESDADCVVEDGGSSSPSSSSKPSRISRRPET